MTISDTTLTTWGAPGEMLVSQYGRTTYLEWLRLEAERINGPHRHEVRIVSRFDGDVALARD